MKEILRKYGLSPNQYFFLIALLGKEMPFKIHPDEINDLINRSFISMDTSSYYILPKVDLIFTSKNELEEVFTELWNLYPHKTPNGRLLRPSSANSQIAKKAFQKLNKQVGNSAEYVQLIKGLKNEINYRTKSRTLNYMQHINTWINQKTWESYVDEDESEEDSSVFDLG